MLGSLVCRFRFLRGYDLLFFCKRSAELCAGQFSTASSAALGLGGAGHGFRLVVAADFVWMSGRPGFGKQGVQVRFAAGRMPIEKQEQVP